MAETRIFRWYYCDACRWGGTDRREHAGCRVEPQLMTEQEVDADRDVMVVKRTGEIVEVREAGSEADRG